MELLTSAETADELKVCRKTVYDLVRSGELNACRLGRSPRSRLRIPRAELDLFLERRTEREHERKAA